jgi:glycerol-3-phosphate acyltransferase PlsY
MYRIIALLIGYVLGCIQTAYYVGKMHGIDIREHGSKNAGMTNAARTMGKKAGIIVFVIDLCKSFAAYIIASLIFQDESIAGIYAGLGAVLGHCFPVLLKFRGGKGVSCALALILIVDWRAALIAFGIAFVLLMITRYISLSSLFIMLIVPVLMFFFGHGYEAVALMAGIAVLIWIMHRENIKKLATGTERKFF